MSFLQGMDYFVLFCGVSILLLISEIVRGQLCPCPPSPVSFEMNFCLSKYSYQGTILMNKVYEDEGSYTLYYDVIIEEIYHGMEDEKEGAIIVVTTGVIGRDCGLPGRPKGTYLFQGRGNSRELTFCDCAESFSSLDASVVSNLRNGTFAANCAYFVDSVCQSSTTVHPDVTKEEVTRAPAGLDLEMTTSDSK